MVVDADVIHGGELGIVTNTDVLVGSSVRRRVELEVVQTDRIEESGWNDVAWDRISLVAGVGRIRIVDASSGLRLGRIGDTGGDDRTAALGTIALNDRACRDVVGEVAGVCLFEGSGHGEGTGQAATNLTEELGIAEEEGLVLEDGPAQAAAELILAQFRLAERFAGQGIRCAKQVRIGVQLVVAEELIDSTVKVVGSALGDDVDDGTTGAACIGREGVGEDADFLNGIDGGTDADGSDDALVVVDSIDELVVDDLGLAVHGDRRAWTTIVWAGTAVDVVRLAFGRTGHNLDEIDEVSSVQRQFLYGA